MTIMRLSPIIADIGIGRIETFGQLAFSSRGRLRYPAGPAIGSHGT